MRPLPRVLACTDDRVALMSDIGIRAAAIAAAGPTVALWARCPAGTANGLATFALRLRALAAPPMAQLFVTGRTDVAMACHASGVVLRQGDLRVQTARSIFANGVILRSVHSVSEAEAAIEEGSDALILGPIWETTTHPGQRAAGTGLLREVVALGIPVFAIGGVNAERATIAHDAGAWGVAAITALWDAARPYRAVRELAQPWANALDMTADDNEATTWN